MDEPGDRVTIDGMFAANPQIAERLQANREFEAALSRNLFGDPAIESEVSRFLCDSLGYNPAIVYEVR